MNRPVIALTMGDPAGIGPELCLRAVRMKEVLRCCRPIIFGDQALLRRVGYKLGLRTPPCYSPVWSAGDGAPAIVNCVEGFNASKVSPGKVQAECGRAAWLCVKKAVSEAILGKVQAIVTAPLHKEALHLAGVPYPGHTEMLAALTGADKYCMMLASQKITVSLVTTHVALRSVPRLITTRRILDVIELTEEAIKRMGRKTRRIVVCALNPHAGEGAAFGTEERKIIIPAVRQAIRKGFNVIGPLPPDTAFIPKRLKETDAYIVMFHDQGLIPFKMLAFDKGVNVTLGLPIIRTSPDHGTAFDVAWKGIASVSSFIESIRLAAKLANHSFEVRRSD